jgi:hypothetical protein
MSHTVTFPPSTSAHAVRRKPDPPRPRKRGRRRRGAERRTLGRYTDPTGRVREVFARRGAAGSVLVVDCDARTDDDSRLVAHLAADEPPENASLVCSHYIRDAASGRGRCRGLTSEDARVAPPATAVEAHRFTAPDPEQDSSPTDLVDRSGGRFRLELTASRMSIPELRWRWHPASSIREQPQSVSLRQVVAGLESYEPACTLTLHALARHEGAPDVSTAMLGAELRRLQESPLVLNRRLREVVLATAARRHLSMSEIASRCGRLKRDGRGNESGETSWLARRLGLLPEANRSMPTPWIHSDVLALIARHGLGMAPREVELQ